MWVGGGGVSECFCGTLSEPTLSSDLTNDVTLPGLYQKLFSSARSV